LVVCEDVSFAVTTSNSLPCEDCLFCFALKMCEVYLS